MSEPDLEEQKKVVMPFLQRAQEMQTADPKVAYYCRMYAIEQAFNFKKRAEEITGLVSAALAQMEKEKPKLGLDKENDRFHCETLALKVFGNADRVDRSGRSDLNTAKTFLAASYFLEILNHFGDVDADLLEKQRYAAWRAAEIRRAVREGRPALPPSSAKEQMAAIEDLPPAYGGSSFGVSSMGVNSVAAEQLPPAYGGSSFGGGSFGGSSLGMNSTASEQLPPTYGGSSFGGSSAVSDSLAKGPPESMPQPPWTSAAASSGALPGQRFKPGSRLLYRADDAQQPELATVGQILMGEGGRCLYKLALRDRLEDVADAGGRLAPNLSEGDPVVVYLAGRNGPASARVVLMNDMSWPPSYLVRLQDGQELAAAADQLSLLEEGTPSAPLPPAAAAPPPPPDHRADSRSSVAAHGPSPYNQPPAESQPPPFQPLRQTYAPIPPVSHAPPQQTPPPPLASVPQPPPAPVPQLPPGHKPSVQAIMDAQKNAKYAVSSLNFEDVPAAVKYLQTALRLLTSSS